MEQRTRIRKAFRESCNALNARRNSGLTRQAPIPVGVVTSLKLKEDEMETSGAVWTLRAILEPVGTFMLTLGGVWVLLKLGGFISDLGKAIQHTQEDN